MSVTKTPNLKDEEHLFLKHRPDGENILRLFRLSEVKGINNKKTFCPESRSFSFPFNFVLVHSIV